jgi:hypothetical protein
VFNAAVQDSLLEHHVAVVNWITLSYPNLFQNEIRIL